MANAPTAQSINQSIDRSIDRWIQSNGSNSHEAMASEWSDRSIRSDRRSNQDQVMPALVLPKGDACR